MRILHTSDWHLGRKFAEYDLTESFIRWGDFLVDLARSEKVDAVLVAGDVYDRSVPGVQMIELFEDILSRLLCTAQVVITSGNHDSATRLGFGAQFLREGLYLQTDSRRSGQPLRLCDKAGNLGAIVYGIPYLDPDVERIRLAPDGVPLARSHFAVLTQACNLIQEDILRSTDIPARVPRIAMAHAFVNGSEKSDSELDLSIGGVDSVPAQIFRLGKQSSSPLNYVALGHLHGPQKVGAHTAPLIRYSGSPIPFSFSEENHQKSTVLLDFNDSQPVHTELIPHNFFRKLKTIRANVAQLCNSPEFTQHEQKYVRIELTDLERPRDLVATLRRRFPYLVSVLQLKQLSPNAQYTTQMLKHQPLDVINQFFAESGGRDLNSAELALIQEIWEETEKIGTQE